MRSKFFITATAALLAGSMYSNAQVQPGGQSPANTPQGDERVGAPGPNNQGQMQQNQGEQRQPPRTTGQGQPPRQPQQPQEQPLPAPDNAGQR